MRSSKNQVRDMAVKGTFNAVKNSHPFTQEQYFGDRYHAPIYTIDGLAEEVLELYYDDPEYCNKKASEKLFEDIAFEIL